MLFLVLQEVPLVFLFVSILLYHVWHSADKFMRSYLHIQCIQHKKLVIRSCVVKYW